jgi:hypothetical protein
MPTGAEELLGKEVAERLIPKGVELLQSWWSGRRLLILGPARAGKTSFLKYLESDILFPERPTKITAKVEKGDSFIFSLGEKRKTKVRIWKPRDVPGQVAPEEHVLYVERYKPDCIVIVLDATKFFLDPPDPSNCSLEWLREFCRQFNSVLIRNKKLARHLRSMTVIMNKWDKIPCSGRNSTADIDTRKRFESSVRAILDECLNNEFYSKGKGTVIEVVSCSLVKSDYQKALADGAVNTVASSLV